MDLELRVATRRETHTVLVTCAAGTPWATVRPRLAELLGRHGPDVWAVDGHPLPDDLRTGHPPLLRGALLTVGPARTTQRPDRPEGGPDATAARARHRLELCVVGGPAAGTVLPLPPGHLVLGRDPTCDLRVTDPTLSRHHAVLGVTDTGVTLADAGSTNGCVVDGETLDGPRTLSLDVPVRLGRSTLVVRRRAVPARAEPDGRGHLRVHPAPSRPLDLPEVRLEEPAPPTPAPRRPFPWLTLLLPLLVCGAMAALLHTPYLLALGLLGPVMVLATHLTERRSRRQETRGAEQDHALAVEQVRRRAEHARAEEAHRLEQRTRDPATALTTARDRDRCLWSCAAPREGVHVRVGRADLPSRVQVRRGELVTREGLHGVPVEVDLREAGVTGLAGPGAQALATAVLGTLATTYPPEALRLHVLCRSARAARRWRWVRRLPHPSSVTVVGSAEGADARRVTALLDGHDPTSDAGAPLDLVLVVDADTEGPARALATVLADRHDGTTPPVVLTTCEDDAALPASARAWVRLGQDGTGVVGLPDGTLVTGTSPDLPPPAWADHLADALAPLVSAAPASAALHPPALVRLSEVVPHALDDATGVAEAWTRPGRRAATVLGRDGAGPVVLDLLRDGPHALVGGTTGSGKSELLQALTVGLALALPPEELTLLLVDYKGGAAFDRCAELPHTCGLITDLDDHSARRALASLRAELTRREHLLRAAGAADLEAYDARRGEHPPLARLVVVVDEFRVLAQELPDFVTGLLTVATIGRSLGVHLVLATQRPAGVVTADIRANVNARIALRMRDRADSVDVIDSPEAAVISDRDPGRALWRSGDGGLRTLQVAWPGAPATDAEHPVQVRLCPDELDSRPAGSDPPPTGGAPARRELDVAVATITRAAALAGRGRAPAAWLPPLPDEIRRDDLSGLLDLTAGTGHDGTGGGPAQPARSGTEASPDAPAAPTTPSLPTEGAAIGVVDLPRRQARVPQLLRLGSGRHLAVVGTHRTGRTTSLRAAALAALAESGGAVHLHVVDGGGDLDDLSALPQCGTLATREDPQQVLRLLQLLDASCHARRECAPTLLLVDRWDAITAAADPVLAAALHDALVAVLRDGPAAGLMVVAAGDRSLLTSSLAAHLADRLLLRLADAADLALCGIPTSARPGHQPPGRALRGEDHAEVQLLHVDADELRRAAALLPGPVSPPLRLAALPARVDADELRRRVPAAIGLGGDGASPVTLSLRHRPVVAVLGPPGSGRSTALVALARSALAEAPARGLVVVASRPGPTTRWARAHGGVVLGGGDDDALRVHLGAHPTAVVLVDGADLLLDAPVETECVRLARAAATGDGTGHVVLVAGTTSQLSVTYRGLAAELRRVGTGLVLQPGHPGDGDLLGVALPRLHQPPPGRGVLVDRGRCTTIQVAHEPTPTDRLAQPDGREGTIVA